MKLIDGAEINLDMYMQWPEECHKVMPASTWVDDVIRIFYPPEGETHPHLGFGKMHEDFELRPGECTLWAGINGHGKSLFLGQAALNLARQGEKICLASLEMPVGQTMSRMARQAFGGNIPGVDYLAKFHKWTDNKIWLYNHVGRVSPKTILALIRYAAAELGVTHFVVDNLTKVVDGDDTYNQQKDFVNDLCTVAQDTQVHVHLVSHIRKGRTENDQPGKFDVKGTGAITDMVDNVLIVWRNKAKEEAARSGDGVDPNEFDCIVKLEKQRHGGTEGKYGFWVNQASLQYLEKRNAIPQHFDCKGA